MQSFGMSHWLIPGSTQFSDVSKAKKVFIRFSSSIVNRETEARDTYLKIIMNGISVKRYIHINFLSENHIAFIYISAAQPNDNDSFSFEILSILVFVCGGNSSI